MATKIQHRRDTEANWLKADPVLMDGEMALVATNPATPNVYDQYKVGGGLRNSPNSHIRDFRVCKI